MESKRAKKQTQGKIKEENDEVTAIIRSWELTLIDKYKKVGIR